MEFIFPLAAIGSVFGLPLAANLLGRRWHIKGGK